MTADFCPCKTQRLSLLQSLSPADKGNLTHEDLLNGSPYHNINADEDEDESQGETLQQDC